MKMNCLQAEIQKLQNDYLNLLKKIFDKLSSDDFPMIIDEINLFWYSRRNIFGLIMTNQSPNEDIFICTGGSYLDIYDYKHFPFLTLGDKHIIDDPLSHFSKSISSVPNSDFKEALKEQIIKTAEINIKIIENYSENISILPVRLLNHSDMEMIAKGAEKLFMGLFKTPCASTSEYLQKYKTIEDVANDLLEYTHKMIVFEEYEEDADLCKRFYNFKSKGMLPFDYNFNDAAIFHTIIIGYFMQALDILFMCTLYDLIPYIQGGIPFNYINLIIGSNLPPEVLDISDIAFKMRGAFLVNRLFDISKMEKIEIPEYKKILEEINFSDNLFEKVKSTYLDTETISIKDYANIVEEELNNLYNYIELQRK